MDSNDKDAIRGAVRDRYAEVAAQEAGCCSSGCGCGGSNAAAEESARMGYTEAELSEVPEGANLGLGCGNPVAISRLRPGETVADLGSGGGLDCFLAAKAVGERGRVIGVDMTPEMLTRARANARRGGYTNVEFRLGEIEHLPVADGSIDVVISNCVINLSPEKGQVFDEAFRVLKPGGRFAVADVVAIRPLPDEVRSDLDAYTGCISGASTVGSIKEMLTRAGFVEVEVLVREENGDFIKDWQPGGPVAEFTRSAFIGGTKPVVENG